MFIILYTTLNSWYMSPVRFISGKQYKISNKFFVKHVMNRYLAGGYIYCQKHTCLQYVWYVKTAYISVCVGNIWDVWETDATSF